MLEGVGGSAGTGERAALLVQKNSSWLSMQFPLLVSLRAAWPLPERGSCGWLSRGAGGGGWIWSQGCHCPAWLCLCSPTLRPTAATPDLGRVQSPRRHSAVILAFIFKGSGRYGAKMGQREGGGNEDFGLKPWPHQQDYNPQLVKPALNLWCSEMLCQLP